MDKCSVILSFTKKCLEDICFPIKISFVLQMPKIEKFKEAQVTATELELTLTLLRITFLDSHKGSNFSTKKKRSSFFFT